MTTVSKTTKQTKFSRRTFLSKTGEVGIAISAGTMASCAPALANTDADLIALCNEYWRLEDAEDWERDSVSQERDGLDAMLAMEDRAMEISRKKHEDVFLKIADMAAHTFDGFAAKLDVYLFHADLSYFNSFRGWENDCADSLIEDLGRLGWKS